MFKKIVCTLFGHKYHVTQKFNKTERRVGCSRCNKDWAMNDIVGSLLDWDGEFEQMYEDMGYEIINPRF